MKLIIDIPEDWEKGIKNMYDWDIANFLYETCRNGTPIPDATVCDIEKIKAEIKERVFDLPKAPCEREYWFGASDAREIAFAVLDKYTKGDRE